MEPAPFAGLFMPDNGFLPIGVHTVDMATRLPAVRGQRAASSGPSGRGLGIHLQLLAPPVPGSVVVTLIPVPVQGEDNELPDPTITSSWTELALAEIVDALPEVPEQASLAEDVVALARPWLQDAINDLASSVAAADIDVEFLLRRPHHLPATARWDDPSRRR